MIGQALPSHSTKEQSISDQHDAISISWERPKLIQLCLEYLQPVTFRTLLLPATLPVLPALGPSHVPTTPLTIRSRCLRTPLDLPRSLLLNRSHVGVQDKCCDALSLLSSQLPTSNWRLKLALPAWTYTSYL